VSGGCLISSFDKGISLEIVLTRGIGWKTKLQAIEHVPIGMKNCFL
jgi:hypothetical protein